VPSGSRAAGKTTPQGWFFYFCLFGIDLGVLLASKKTGRQLFETHLALRDYLNRKPETDEVDLVLFNEAPVRIAYSIIRNGRLLLCRDGKELTDFINEILVNQQINQSTNQHFHFWFVGFGGFS
jgi:hypothetical protein